MAMKESLTYLRRVLVVLVHSLLRRLRRLVVAAECCYAAMLGSMLAVR